MLNPFASIRPGEHRTVQGALITLWGIMASHSILETARDALFLGSISPQRLPWVYLCIAIAAVGLMQLQSKLPLGSGNRRVLGSLLAGSSVITLGLWALLGTGQPWVLAAVYIWTGVFATLVVVRFWMVVDDVFTVTQAKRVFALIGAGSVFGAISGSAMARLMAIWVEPRHFLLVAVVLIAVTSILPVILLRSADEKGVKDTKPRDSVSGTLPWTKCKSMILDRPYVKRLMGLVLLSTIAFTLVDYLFKSIIATSIAPENLATFFSTTYLSLNALSLLLQLTLVGWLLRTVGLDRVLGVTPALVLAGAATLMMFYTLWPLLILVPAVGLKTADGSLRHSLHRTSLEMLYVPLTRELREQVKTFIDVLGQRGGQALASLLILAIQFLPAWQMILAITLFAVSWIWIRLGLDLRRHYLDLFRDTLRDGRIDNRIDFPELDLATLETLIARLNSSDDLEVLAALDLLEEQDRVHLIPALLLYHPSSSVVNRTLQLFRTHERKDALSVIERLADDEDASIRASVLLTRAKLAPDVNRQLKEFLDDSAAMVRATALVTLVAANWIEGQDAEKSLRAIAADAPPDELQALIVSIQQQPHPIHRSVLLELAERERENRPLLREIALAMRAVGDESFLDPLIQMLPFRELRNPARMALVDMGQPAIDRLAEHLGDEDYPNDVRRHIPRTLSRFEPSLVGDTLLGHLLEVQDGLVRFKILRALGGLRSRDPDLPLDSKILYRAIEATLTNALRLIDWDFHMRREAAKRPKLRTHVHELLLEAIAHKRGRASERVFRLLNLWHPEENWESVHRGLQSTDPARRASSLELIEGLLDEPLRSTLHAYVDDVSDLARLRAGRTFYTRRAWQYEEVLTAFLDQGSFGLRCITVHHIGELELESFRDRLESMLESSSPAQLELVTKALDRLGAGGPA